MNKTDIQPTKGHVLVEPYQKPEETGGIILAGEQQNSAPVRGDVLRISEGGSPFAVGETIFFRKYAIDELKFINEDGVEDTVFLVDEREVLGVVRSDEKQPVDRTEERALSKEADKNLRKVIT